MNLTPAEIENIVRQVVRTWMDGGLPAAKEVKLSSQPAGTDIFATSGDVISIASIRDHLSGVKTLRVPSKSIVTPAVKDLCKEKGISIERLSTPLAVNASRAGSENTTGTQVSDSVTATVPRPQRIIVAGTSEFMDAIAKQICPKQAKVLGKCKDDAEALQAVQEGLSSGHQAAVVIADSPYAAVWQAAKQEKLRPVAVSQWSDVSTALQEVPLNVLIIPRKHWSIPSICNASRLLFEHLKRAS